MDIIPRMVVMESRKRQTKHIEYLVVPSDKIMQLFTRLIPVNLKTKDKIQTTHYKLQMVHN